MDLPKRSIQSWIRPLYLYAVSLVSLVTFIVGAVTILNLVIRNQVFGLKSSWYNSPEMNCEGQFAADSSGRFKTLPGGQVVPMPEAERKKAYDECVVRQTKENEMREKYEFANSISNGFAMIIVSLPLYLLHWNLIKREGKKRDEETVA